MIADAARIAAGCAWTNVGECAFYTRFGLQAAIVFQRERRPWTGAIEKTFSEIIKAGFVLFEQTPAPRRANLRFGTAPALNRRIPSNRGAS
jgi:hypothetical protein